MNVITYSVSGVKIFKTFAPSICFCFALLCFWTLIDLELTTNKISHRSQDVNKRWFFKRCLCPAVPPCSWRLTCSDRDLYLCWEQGWVSSDHVTWTLASHWSTEHSILTSLLWAALLSTELWTPGPGASSHHSQRHRAPLARSRNEKEYITRTPDS